MNRVIRPKEYFTQVSNHILANNKISYRAKGIFAYLISKPNNYEFSSDRIADDSKEGRKAILSAIKEIEDSGYLHRQKKPDGKIDYIFFSSPLDKAKFLFGTLPKGHGGTQALINKTDSYNNTNNINTKEKKKKKFDAETYIENLEGHDQIKQHLLDWIEVRKAKKTATTERAIELALGKLEGKSIPTQIKMLENSIERGYTGIFEVKETATTVEQPNYNNARVPRTLIFADSIEEYNSMVQARVESYGASPDEYEWGNPVRTKEYDNIGKIE